MQKKLFCSVRDGFGVDTIKKFNYFLWKRVQDDLREYLREKILPSTSINCWMLSRYDASTLLRYKARQHL